MTAPQAPGGNAEPIDGNCMTSEPLAYGDFTYAFRSALAAFLGRSDVSRQGEPPDPVRLMPTAGVSQALDLVSTMCASAVDRDIVLVEAPTYFLSSAIFRDHGLEVRGVCTDAEGPVCESFVAQVRSARAEGRRVAFFYVIPVHHNPSARTMTAARRAELCTAAKEHDVILVADEVYTLLTYSQEALPPSLSSYGDHVLSISSFSKILAPGLRVGWIEGSPALLQKLSSWGVIGSGGHISHFSSSVVAAAMRLRLVDGQLAELRARYRSRAAALMEALRKHLPDGCEAPEAPRGGYFVWLKLPPGVTAPDLADRAAEPLRDGSGGMLRGVRFKVGSVFCPGGRGDLLEHGDRYLRLCFARLPEGDLQEGAQRLCTEIAALLAASAANAAEPQVKRLRI